ncbi:ATF/CREB family transcription factor [Entomortierella parvispora]|uniref:ATF/CREB family transcription factor n=1 Tax=Entomortierella parvispora TaxID=205924 RepID=A0A9P3H3Q6_9FUNG|nr:ATF/CREB family transcription factor [Entomortierella parvispora]
MTTVGSLPGDLASGNEVSCKTTMDLLPSPTNSVPYIIATAVDGAKTEAVVAPIHGGSPMRYLQASSKLDQEPNPFEQSFSGMAPEKSGAGAGGPGPKVETPKPVLPPIASMSGRLAPGTDQFEWDAQSLRMGPLSPSMLEGPQNPIVFEKDTSSLPLPIGSFPPPSSGSMANVLIANGFGASGPLPGSTLPAHSSESYPPATYNPTHSVSQVQQPSVPAPHMQHQQQYQGGNGSRPQNPQQQRPQQYAPHPNDRYMPPPPPPTSQHQGAAPHQDMNGYGNLHLLSQAQATHREHWTKRENADSNNGSAPLGQHPHPYGPQSHPQPSAHGHMNAQSGPHINGQPQHAMGGMTASHQQQQPQNGGEPSFARKVTRRSRAQTEESDDSERSEMSGKNGQGSEGNSHKKQAVGQGVNGTGDEKMDEEEKRKNFLERNRQAALKCRQRKKQWLSNLQAKVEYLSTDNEHLQAQTAALRDEIIHLKALLLAHKDCPVAQANGAYAESINMTGPPPPGHGPGPMGGPHGRAPPHPQQQHQQQSMQGRPGPGPGLQGRGPMPPHPQQFQHGALPTNMQNGIHPPPGSMVPGGPPGGRPMSMMQDITPNASPSQGQMNGRY